ncbi:MAG: hypothetical protein R6U27_15395 [Desulfobacterales bacterium]
MILKKAILLSGLFYFILLFSSGFSEADDSKVNEPTDTKWAVTLFNGIYTNRTIGKALLNIPGDFEQNYMHALALSRKIWESERHFSFELEGMVAKHHGKHETGRQNYEEYTLAMLLRYHTFPWNKHLNTSVAVGEGFSLTSKTPKLELQSYEGKSQKFLNYLAIELTLTLPKYPNVSLCYRIHHRSGVFGTFGGVKGASDFYLLGLRYRF